jgi:hypothetical protein
VPFVQNMDLKEIIRPKYGWETVLVSFRDHRIHVLRRGEEWYFGVCWRGWKSLGRRGRLDHLDGPFPNRGVAEAVVRRWFVQYPVGAVAELLARTPYDPQVRVMLEAMNDGDLLAWDALADHLKETCVPEALIEEVKFLTACIGVRPVDVDVE